MGNTIFNLVSDQRLITADELKPYTTSFLLKLKKLYSSYYRYEDRYCNSTHHSLQIRIANWETLKSVLDTRPHVPNKLESKAARILRKKQGKGR